MDFSGVRALVVEDEALVALDVEEALAEAGLEVVGIAADCEEALKIIAKVRVSVAVLDVNLGSETSRRVADKLSAERIPFIFYTSYAERERPHWLNGPIVSKPCSRRDLLNAVASVVLSPGRCSDA